MPSSEPLPDLEKALRATHQGTTVFGGGLMVWGIAPLIVERFAGRGAPQGEVVAFGLAMVAIGLGLVGLAVHARRGKPWALWTSGAVSTLVLVTSLWAFCVDAVSMPLFPVLLSATAAVPSANALLAVRAHANAHRTFH